VPAAVASNSRQFTVVAVTDGYFVDCDLGGRRSGPLSYGRADCNDFKAFARRERSVFDVGGSSGDTTAGRRGSRERIAPQRSRRKVQRFGPRRQDQPAGVRADKSNAGLPSFPIQIAGL
jgi:hypothetical protein